MTDKPVLDAIKRIRDAQTTDPDLMNIVVAVCGRAGVLDLGQLAREHPDTVIDLAEELTSVSAQLEHDDIQFEDLG